jgi:hypothetical protein
MINIKTYKKFNIDVLNHELLHYSDNVSSLNKMRELLNNGANPNCRNGISLTPLHIACSSIFYSGIKLLIENGADVNLTTEKNVTPFYSLISRISNYQYSKQNNVINKIIDILIENGADLSIMPIDRDWIEYAPSEFVEYVKTVHPEEYNEYLMKKNANKYNL